jgi:quercetin dioxygenase-like cupin family protein
MSGFVLRLLEDRLQQGAERHLEQPAARAVYVVTGAARCNEAGLEANTAWGGSGPVTVSAGSGGAHLLRWELGADLGGPEPDAAEKLAARLELEPGRHLLRCDRVDFPPGGVAYLHTHQGPGIRCLVAGELAVDVDGERRTVRPLEAWFERGPDPVEAFASPDAPTAFVRVMVLPERLRGQPSIRYVRPEDRERLKPQRYTVFVDEPVEL